MCTQEEVGILAKTKTTAQKMRRAERIRRRASDKLNRLLLACGGNPRGRDLRQARRLREVAGA